MPHKDSFWNTLPRPFFALAPMEEVTDTVFRRIVVRCGRPDVMFTEFTNAEGAMSVGQAQVVKRLRYTPEERPLVAQIWGTSPERYFQLSQIIKEMGFDGVDINMGCPVKKIISKGACSALIKNPTLAKEIIQATKEGAAGLPVSVKTRIGFNHIQTEEWIGFLLQQQLDVLSVHGRTVKELSAVPVHWDEVAKAVQLKNQISPETLIIGNGDILSRVSGLKLAEIFGLDGLMIGRGIFHNPWVFNSHVDPESISIGQKLQTLIDHVLLFKEEWGADKPFAVLKRFFKIYISDFPGSAQLRSECMECKTADEVVNLVSDYLKNSLNHS